MEEKEKTRDGYHQDALLWGERITDIVARVVAATERDQKEEVGLEAAIHAHLTQSGGPEKPEERQQLNPGRLLKSEPMPKPEPNPTPKPMPAPARRPEPTPTPRTTSAPTGATSAAPTPTRRSETVPPRNQKKPAIPAPSPTTASSMADRCLILRIDESVPLPKRMD